MTMTAEWCGVNDKHWNIVEVANVSFYDGTSFSGPKRKAVLRRKGGGGCIVIEDGGVILKNEAGVVIKRIDVSAD